MIYILLGMWTIYEKKSLEKKIKKVPKEVLKHYEIWKRIVEFEGLQGLYTIKGFHDEALKGDWKGYRSSRLNLKWRVIYKAHVDHFEIYVIEINPHQY
jgi:addiction module RelE/StbE family toxin